MDSKTNQNSINHKIENLKESAKQNYDKAEKAVQEKSETYAEIVQEKLSESLENTKQAVQHGIEKVGETIEKVGTRIKHMPQ